MKERDKMLMLFYWSGKDNEFKPFKQTTATTAASGLRCVMGSVLHRQSWRSLISSDAGDRGFRSHEGENGDEREAEGETRRDPKNSEESGQGGQTQVRSMLLCWLYAIKVVTSNIDLCFFIYNYLSRYCPTSDTDSNQYQLIPINVAVERTKTNQNFTLQWGSL